MLLCILGMCVVLFDLVVVYYNKWLTNHRVSKSIVVIFICCGWITTYDKALVDLVIRLLVEANKIERKSKVSARKRAAALTCRSNVLASATAFYYLQHFNNFNEIASKLALNQICLTQLTVHHWESHQTSLHHQCDAANVPKALLRWYLC